MISARLLRRTARTSMVLIYLVIIAGSIVRMTGSGMGCPDWPKCFGYIIPPTEEAQVLWQPEKAYSEGQFIKRDNAFWEAKEDFVSGDVYNAIHWEKYTKHDYNVFNPMHTWIEYLNRLAGALSGFPVLLLFAISLLRIPFDWKLVMLSFATLVMLGFEAVLGKLVVDGNLIPGQITIHMMGALLIVFLLVAILHRLRRVEVRVSAVQNWFHPLLWIVALVQIVLGTRVREGVDALYSTLARDEWIDSLGFTFEVHRTAAWVVVLLVGYLLMKENAKGKLSFPIRLIVLSVAAEVVLGIVLSYFAMPTWSQPLHLLFAVLLFTGSSMALLRTFVMGKLS